MRRRVGILDLCLLDDRSAQLNVLPLGSTLFALGVVRATDLLGQMKLTSERRCRSIACRTRSASASPWRVR
jgi:hypothetical protein